MTHDVSNHHVDMASYYATNAAKGKGETSLSRDCSFECIHLQNLGFSRRILQNLAESCRILQNLAESCRILQNLAESCKILQNLAESFRILDDLAKVYNDFIPISYIFLS